MQNFIEITFLVLKKGKPDTYRSLADYHKLDEVRYYRFPETKRDLRLKHHILIEGCMIEVMNTGDKYLCDKSVYTSFTKSKYPFLQVSPFA